MAEVPPFIGDETRVIVTFLENNGIDLRTRGIDAQQAADLRARLATFAADWDSPEMSMYDSFDAAKTLLDELEASKPKPAEDTFRQGWLKAQNRQTRPVAELWDGIDAD